MSFIPVLGYSPSYLRGLSKDDLLSNGGFETAGAGGADIWANWTETAGDGTLANETSLVHEGADSAKMTAGATKDTRISQTITLVAGKKYRLRFWTRGDGTYDGLYQIWDVSNSAWIKSGTHTGVTGTAYAVVVHVFTAPAGCISAYTQLLCSTTEGGVCYFDACEVRALV